MAHDYTDTLAHVNTYSKPSELIITDVKVCDIEPPFSTTLIKIMTNQGICGYGQVRENGSRVYALMLKRLLLGENPCNVDKLFRRMKQFGGHSHQGGGVSGMEIALWDIAGKAYGVPVWQMLGGKFRDKVRLYCDTDVYGKPDGKKMGKTLEQRIAEKGYTFVKMDLSTEEILMGIPGTFTCPTGFNKEYDNYNKKMEHYFGNSYRDDSLSREEQLKNYADRNRMVDITAIPGPSTGLHLTEKGLDIVEQYVADVRSVVGYELPIAADHLGHIGVGDIIRLSRRLEKYNLAWLEDTVPWYMTNHLQEIARNSTTPICTGEDIYLKEDFIPLLQNKAVGIIHPDIMTAGGIYESKKIGDMAQDYNVPMAIHMNETAIAGMAAVQVAAATENFMIMEFHHHDYPWWSDLVNTKENPIVQDGFINVPNEPGLGFGDVNDEVLAEHLHIVNKGQLWQDTNEWDEWYAMDRLWL